MLLQRDSEGFSHLRPGRPESCVPRPVDRWVAVAMVVLWSPVALIGLVLTVTIFWLPFGVPMLAGVLPARVGWRSMRGRPFRSWWATVGVVAPWVFVGIAASFLAGLPGDVLESGGTGWSVLAAIAVVLSWLSAIARRGGR